MIRKTYKTKSVGIGVGAYRDGGDTSLPGGGTRGLLDQKFQR